MSNLVNMSHKIFIRFWVILMLLITSTIQPTTAQPKRSMNTVKTSQNMNSSELAIVEIVRTACSDLLTKAYDPSSIAMKFGDVIDIQSTGYYVEPFNNDLSSIEIDLRGSLPAPPYPAYAVNLELRRNAPISIKALGEAFGTYKDIYQSNINYETISFDNNISGLCRVYIDFKRTSEQNIENGKIIRIYVVK
jgi:hypothetical protein